VYKIISKVFANRLSSYWARLSPRHNAFIVG
jgi:hypothetical protein